MYPKIAPGAYGSLIAMRRLRNAMRAVAACTQKTDIGADIALVRSTL